MLVTQKYCDIIDLNFFLAAASTIWMKYTIDREYEKSTTKTVDHRLARFDLI